MPKMQMLSAHINLGGDRDNVVVRDRFNPISYAEALVLRYIHGGDDHVHTLIETDRKETSHVEERERLRLRYGKAVDAVFPNAAAGGPLAVSDDSLPTLADVEAAEQAASEALASRKTRKTLKSAKVTKQSDDQPDLPSDDQPDGQSAPGLPDLTTSE